MASSERIQRALAAASALTVQEREELVAQIILGLDRDRDPEPGYDDAWSTEIRRRVNAALSGSAGTPWSEVRREIRERLVERRRRSE
jgi:putative addiction module component (TIGR02574 family)